MIPAQPAVQLAGLTLSICMSCPAGMARARRAGLPKARARRGERRTRRRAVPLDLRTARFGNASDVEPRVVGSWEFWRVQAVVLATAVKA
jgi:hypothetical protein